MKLKVRALCALTRRVKNAEGVLEINGEIHMQIDELCKLINTVAAAGVSAFSYEEDGVKVAIKGKKATFVPEGMQQVCVMPAASDSPRVNRKETAQTDFSGTGTTIDSPLVGTFYLAASADAEPFVRVGDTVKAGQTVGIIEAMKLMNEIEAETDGVITELLAENEEAVEYGQPLFRVRPL